MVLSHKQMDTCVCVCAQKRGCITIILHQVLGCFTKRYGQSLSSSNCLKKLPWLISGFLGIASSTFLAFWGFVHMEKKKKILSKIDETGLYSLYPTLLTSYVTTTNGSNFCPGHKFPFLESLFCGWACQLLDKYKRSIKIFIWSWHNVQLRLKLGYSGQSYIFSLAGTDWDSKGAAVTCSQLRA